MIKICAKNLEIVENNNQFIIDDYNGFKGINILGEQFLFDRIPHTNVGEYEIYFMSKAGNDYIIFNNMKEQFYQLGVELKKNIVNNEPTIIEIDTTLLVKENTFLSCFIQSSQDGIKNLLENKLPLLFNSLPYSQKELEWNKEKIKKVLSNKVEQTPQIKKNFCGANPTKFYDVFGEKLTVREMSDKYGIRQDTLRARLDKGMSVEDAVTMKVQETGWRLRK